MLVLLLAGLCASSAEASPHHFQEWSAGQFVSDNSATHELTVRDPATSMETHFKWDKRTVLFHPGQKKGARLDEKAVDELKAGTPLRVLYVKQGKNLLARRIVE